MKARPILFSTPMVKALLDGRKTQTRRIIKNPDDGVSTCISENDNPPVFCFTKENRWIPRPCPYGKVGDILWVRETWGIKDNKILYAADAGEKPARWSPSIHMFKDNSRLTLEITNVRVERLQEITEIDAIAEGCRPYFDKENPVYLDCPNGNKMEAAPLKSPEQDYARLWNLINGAGSWDKNPFVWVIEFKVHKINVDAFLQAANPAA